MSLFFKAYLPILYLPATFGMWPDPASAGHLPSFPFTQISCSLMGSLLFPHMASSTDTQLVLSNVNVSWVLTLGCVLPALLSDLLPESLCDWLASIISYFRWNIFSESVSVCSLFQNTTIIPLSLPFLFKIFFKPCFTVVSYS